MLVHLFFILLFSHRASLSHSHLSNFSQAHSLKLSPLYFTFIAATEARRHRPTNRPKPPISLKPTPPSALDSLLFRHRPTSGQSLSSSCGC